MQIGADVVEQPLAGAQKRRHEADLHLVDEAGREILLRGLRAAAERDILVAGGRRARSSAFAIP